ncbi:hypothetical protein FRC12_014985 [Ceratobasidium sp. 428]|nr:hypothetical protein FRC12_014985 [Ceratobasidium sp. 428]
MPDLASFRPLGTLPLTEVCLKGDIYILDSIEDLAAIWPNVIRFEMWDTDGFLALEDLEYFTKLPRVQHLALPVFSFCDVPLPVTPAGSSYALRTFEVLKRELDTPDFDVSLLAQYLLSLWPNLESVHWPWADKPQPSDRETNTIIKALNNMVASQRNFNRLKSRIVDKCGLNMLDELLR